MKKLMIISLIMTLATGLMACGGSDDEGGNDNPSESVTLSVSTNAIHVGQASSTETFTVEASADWAVYADDDCKSWVSLSPSSGIRGTVSINVTIAENTAYSERSGNIIAMSGTKRASIAVTQDAAEKPVVDERITCPFEGYELVWNDEFDEGNRLSKDWTHEVQKQGWVNNELQNYVNGASPGGKRVTELDNGVLKINCFKEDGKVYSGRVYAHVGTGWQYGYFEASIKLPKGKGTWPAYWMMPVGNDWNTNPWPKCGEIDIMEEVGVVPNEVSSSIHTQDYNHTKNTQKTHAMTIANAEGAFHTYALLWTADEITTYVDGKVQLNVKKSVLGSGHNQWPFHYAFYPIFNLAWGGDWGGMNGVDESALPVTMEVDYIRVFQKK